MRVGTEVLMQTAGPPVGKELSFTVLRLERGERVDPIKCAFAIAFVRSTPHYLLVSLPFTASMAILATDISYFFAGGKFVLWLGSIYPRGTMNHAGYGTAGFRRIRDTVAQWMAKV